MTYLILTIDHLAALAELNASGTPNRQLTPVELTDGRRVLNTDLLNDCGPGQTWEHYGPFLRSTLEAEIEPELFRE
jgi:hypothetical protein